MSIALFMSYLGLSWFFYAGPDAVGQVASIFFYPALLFQTTCIDPIKVCLASRTPDEQLLHSYEQLLQEHIQLQALYDIQQEIQELIPFKKQYGYEQAQLAHIMQRHFGTDTHYFFVNRGSQHGIKNNMVAVYKNVLIGKVKQVYPYYAQIALITDASCKIAAYCAQTKAYGITKGVREHGLRLLHVSHLAHMREGDIVLSSGEGLIFPKGFGVARVTSFSKDGLLYEVTCEPLVDLKTLHYCYLFEKQA